MYERQHGNEFEVGSYAHRPILMDPDDIPSIAEAALSPTMLPFTQEDFDPQLEDALELFPEVVGDEKAGVKLAINGLLSLTPGRQPDHRRDAGGQGPLVRRGDLDQGGARDRPLRRRVDDERRARDRPARLGHRPVLRPPPDRSSTSRRARPRATTRPTASSTRWSSGRPTAACGSRRSTSARRRSAPSSSRPRAGSGRTGTARTSRSSPSTATASCRARPSGNRAGGRRSSTPSTSRCAIGPGWWTCPRS